MIYTKISIVEAAKLCNIHIKDTGRAEARCRCPFCDNGRGKPTASINKDRGVFHCFRCGEGLNSVTLFAKINGMDTKVAYRELMEKVA
jgi:DNA primase